MSFSSENQIMKKNQILKIIAKLFKEKGYHNTSMKEISNEVGLEGGALYYYIKSKEQVLFEIGDNAIDQLLFQLEKINNAVLTPREKLQLAVETHINFLVEKFYECCVFIIETKALGPEYQRHYTSKRDKYEGILRKIIEEGMKRGEFKKGDVRLITFAILGMLNWLVIWFRPNKGWSSEKISKDLTELILKGVLKR